MAAAALLFKFPIDQLARTRQPMPDYPCARVELDTTFIPSHVVGPSDPRKPPPVVLVDYEFAFDPVRIDAGQFPFVRTRP